MNFIKYLSFVLALFALATINQSCSKDCSVDCLNGGTCNDGNCECAAGYEGNDCSAQSRVKYIGIYNVDENCSNSGAATYNALAVVADASTPADSIFISGLNRFIAFRINATIDKNVITIPLQQPDNNGFSIEGTGVGTNNANDISIDWSLTITDTANSTSETCTSTATKRL